MGSFLEATHVAAADDRLVASLDPDWFIWGPFGGYLAGLAMRAAGVHARHRRPAAFSCQFLNVGAAGPVHITVESLKSGRTAECLRIALFQGDSQLLEAQAWVIEDTLTGLDHEHTHMPRVPLPEDVALYAAIDDAGEESSAMWNHVERRPRDVVDGAEHLPCAPEWACWLRFREKIPAKDWFAQAARAIMWMDLAPWNAVVLAHTWPMTHVAPTLNLTVQFQAHLCAPSATTSDWMLAYVESPTAHNGLLGARGEVWSEDGKLVSLGTAQAVCVPNPRLDQQLETKRRRLASSS